MPGAVLGCREKGPHRLFERGVHNYGRVVYNLTVYTKTYYINAVFYQLQCEPNVLYCTLHKAGSQWKLSMEASTPANLRKCSGFPPFSLFLFSLRGRIFHPVAGDSSQIRRCVRTLSPFM